MKTLEELKKEIEESRRRNEALCRELVTALGELGGAIKKSLEGHKEDREKCAKKEGIKEKGRIHRDSVLFYFLKNILHSRQEIFISRLINIFVTLISFGTRI